MPSSPPKFSLVGHGWDIVDPTTRRADKDNSSTNATENLDTATGQDSSSP